MAGSVELVKALAGPHIYGLGIIANAEGVITVLDGEVWLNYGEDGINVTRSMIPEGEEAALLITAQVEKWRKIPAPEDMSEHQLYDFIRRQARNLGIDTTMPFPFLIKGRIKNLVWDVLNGLYVSTGKIRDRLFLRKLVEYKDSIEATLIGFYPGKLRNEFTYPGELWYVHALFRDEDEKEGEKITGDANTFVVSKGAQIELPLK